MLAVAAAAALLAAGISATGALDRVEGDTVDLRFDLRGERAVGDVAVVAIDDETFSELDVRWPFSRTLHARVLDQLREAGARTIAYDVQFTEPAEDPAEDNALIRAVGRAHPVLATTEVDSRGRTAVLGGDGLLRELGARAGHTGVRGGAGGVVRDVQPSIEGLDTFAVAAVEEARGRKFDPRSFPGGRAPIDYAGPPGTISSIPFSRVLRGRFDPADVRGKIVVVGATAPSLQDLHATPVSGGLMPGPEVHANGISTVLRGLPLREAPGWAGLLAIALLALVAPLASLRLRAWLASVVALLALAAYLGAAVLAFGSGLILPVVAPALAAVLAAVGALAVHLTIESRERRRTRELFGRFVDGAVVKELLDRPGAGRHLPGERIEATVMFCDLRGFTAFAEGQPAERVLEVLNRYLGEMSEAILDRGGTVVSYMGDGVMAVFGAPLQRPDHAQAAYEAAREMMEVRLPRLNAWLGERGMPSFRLGVGLNTGPVMSGTVGSERRLEYATIGDTTNVAARLEAMTKETGGGLLVADSTKADIFEGGHDLERRGDLEVRGRSEHVTVWFLALPAQDAVRAADTEHVAS